MIDIRAAAIEDVEAIYTLIEATCQKVACFGKRSREYITDGILGFVVAEEEGRIVGSGQLVVLKLDSTSEIRAMCVDHALQRKGVGTRILAALLGKVQTKRILVECVPHNCAFYEKFGFRLTGMLKDIFMRREPDDLYEAIKTYPSECTRFPDQCPGMMLTMNSDQAGRIA
ncbi:MAG: GNAT family N-acetyltransferase [bacterium]